MNVLQVDRRRAVSCRKHTFRSDGHLHPGEAPGIGVELAAAHPYAAAYLPVNRLHDGTVHDW